MRGRSGWWTPVAPSALAGRRRRRSGCWPRYSRWRAPSGPCWTLPSLPSEATPVPPFSSTPMTECCACMTAAAPRRDVQRARIPAGEGILGGVVRRGVAVRMVSEGGRAGVGWYQRHVVVKAVCAVPLQEQSGQLRGVLLADRLEAEAFTDGDEQLLTILAREVLRALEVETGARRGAAGGETRRPVSSVPLRSSTVRWTRGRVCRRGGERPGAGGARLRRGDAGPGGERRPGAPGGQGGR